MLLPPSTRPAPWSRCSPRCPPRASRSATSCPTPATPTATPTPGPSRCGSPAPQLIQDLHPSDRGPRGTHHGAIIANGNLYCPATPPALLQLGPLARDATPEQVATHDTQAAELARHKLGKITCDDADGYHRVMCPAVMSKIRCPLRPASMTLTRDRPEILTPPEHPPACCTQQTITVPPQTCAQNSAKTRLPVKAAPQVLRPAHRRRTDLLHRQGPRQQQHRPRLDPAHGPDPDHALAHLPARRPQPAHPHRLERPPGRQRPPRRCRPAAKTRRRRRKTLTDLATAGTPP